MRFTPESVKKSLDKKHYNIYKLVYDRFIASQMAEAQYNTMQIEATSAGYVFKASGRSLLFAGYTAAYQDAPKEKDDDEEAAKLLPPLQEGDALNLKDFLKEQKFTRPPLRYTDASLVKAMEEKGIGRPSTYASIISVLTRRRYVEKDGKYMAPTEVAYKITDMLCHYFKDIMDVGFTAHMEDDLDKIEEGGTDWHKIIADFYPGFAEKLKTASTDGDELTDIMCEKCGHPMIRRTGKYGKYLACSNYPACSNIISESRAGSFRRALSQMRRKYGGQERQVRQIPCLPQLSRMLFHTAYGRQNLRGKVQGMRRRNAHQKGQIRPVSRGVQSAAQSVPLAARRRPRA